MENIIDNIVAESQNIELIYFDREEIHTTQPISTNENSDVTDGKNINYNVTFIEDYKKYTKNIELTKRNNDFDKDKYISAYLNKNLNINSKYNFTDNDILSNLHEELRKSVGFYLRKHINSVNLVMNKLTFDTYMIGFNDLSLVSISINESINDNEICIVNKTGENKPGYKYVEYIDENNTIFSDVVTLGWFFEKTAYKFKIIA